MMTLQDTDDHKGDLGEWDGKKNIPNHGNGR